MSKYLCEVCQKEVYNPAISIDMTGMILCSDHYAEFMGINLDKNDIDGLSLISYIGYAKTSEEVTKIVEKVKNDIEEERKEYYKYLKKYIE